MMNRKGLHHPWRGRSLDESGDLKEFLTLSGGLNCLGLSQCDTFKLVLLE